MKRIHILLFLFLSFHVSILSGQELSFGLLTDIHNADIPNSGTREYRLSLQKMHTCIDTMIKRKVSFLVEMGDLKDMAPEKDTLLTMSYLKKIEQEYSRFPGNRYHVLGNHDMDCISKSQFNRIAVNSQPATGKSWYTFQKGDYRFIVLDACFDSLGRAYENGNFSWKDANIPAEELQWLKSEMKKSQFPTIVFVHQLLFGNGPATIRNAAEVRSILESGKNVKCVFQGHDHAGGYEKINGIHYYILRGMIEPGSSFARIIVGKDQIKIIGYGNAESMNLLLN